MTKLSIALIAALAALSLSACDRPRENNASGDQAYPPRVAQGPDQSSPPQAQADQPADKDKEQGYRDPSVPPNPPENQPTQASENK